jgi:PAS domain S-box-containing protein
MDAQTQIDNTHQAIISAIDKSQGTIEFSMDGTIVTANDNFLKIIGYALEEIQGQHHRIFCEESYASSHEYQEFWERMNRGEFNSGEYMRVGKDGGEVCLQATYNPILDSSGKPAKVIKIATDITEKKVENSEFQGIIDAIDKSQGTIEFNMDGTIITANENFLKIIGYALDEVQGQHHRIFCEESYASSDEYQEFWKKMNRGEFNSGEYKRVGKDGREVYLQATYNPILDLSGRPRKVLKVAADISKQKRLDAERSRQAALIMEMSTPVMQLWDKILLLPIVGLVDSKRVQLIMETALQMISDYQAEIIILDIQGVPAVDSAVANHLIKVTKATKLMGCTCIVTGISPEVSQALVNLGIELTEISTKSTLKNGVNAALGIIGVQLTQI